MPLIIKCQYCGNSQKFLPLKQISEKSRKKCVYCGKSVRVYKQIIGESER